MSLNTHSLLAVTVAFLALVAVVSNAEYSTEDCKELGYDKSQLVCSSCEKLADFSLQDLQEHCRECCRKDDPSPASRQYARAVLEVCTCKFGAYPQIQAFVQSDRPAKFANLRIKYVRGLDPIVKLLDGSGTVRETLSIKKWNTDTVEEFFQTHLASAADAISNHIDDEPEEATFTFA